MAQQDIKTFEQQLAIVEAKLAYFETALTQFQVNNFRNPGEESLQPKAGKAKISNEWDQLHHLYQANAVWQQVYLQKIYQKLLAQQATLSDKQFENLQHQCRSYFALVKQHPLNADASHLWDGIDAIQKMQKKNVSTQDKYLAKFAASQEHFTKTHKAALGQLQQLLSITAKYYQDPESLKKIKAKEMQQLQRDINDFLDVLTKNKTTQQHFMYYIAEIYPQLLSQQKQDKKSATIKTFASLKSKLKRQLSLLLRPTNG